MSTVDVGHAAEQKAAEHLATLGYTILARNWRTRWCELDIVATRRGVVHIVEVKYRKTTQFGYAAEYVSYDKATRLIRATLSWTQTHRYTGAYQIDVVTVEGRLEEPHIMHLENVITS